MSVVDEIKSRLDIADVAADYVALQKAGRNLKALCPFHTEKTPSFIVNPERQSWHCFGACATGGDVFSLVMRAERMDFGETLKLLAQKTGVALVQEQKGDRYDLLYKINQEAADFYSKVLASPEGKVGMDYLSERGVDAEMVSTFGLGLSPRGGDRLRAHVRGLGFESERALEAGLLHRGENGVLRDFFWGRLMFPIHDRQGRVAGFGARSLDGTDPKYLNTAATPIFDKRATVYGFHLAATSIREQNTVVVVEGYMDVLAAHQFGHTNVVASMGTALTEQQVAQLKAAARTYILALDPDAAGQEATRRSLESSWRALSLQRVGGRTRSMGSLYQREPLSLSIAGLPAGRDPDAMIRQDPEEWERLVREAVPFMEFLITTLDTRYDLSAPQGRAQAAEEMGPLITSEGNAVEQEHYFEMLAATLGVSRKALEASIGRPKAGPRARPSGASSRAPARDVSVSPLMSNREEFLEDYVLALLLGRPALREHAGPVTEELFHRTENKEVFTGWLSCSTMDELRDVLNDGLQQHLDYLSDIELSPIDLGSAETALGQAVTRLEQRHLRELQEGLLASEDAASPPPRELEEVIVSVNARLKELFTQR